MQLHPFCRRIPPALAAILVLACGAATALAQSEPAIKLYKVISQRDEVEIGLTAAELKALGAGPEIEALAKKLVEAGQITVWQYAVQRTADGGTAHMPVKKIAILRNDTLRIEPFNPAPLKAVPPGPDQ
jgi:hypothetical protein